MREENVHSVEDFFEWLPSFMCDGDTLKCEEDN